MSGAEDGDVRPVEGERAVALTDALLGLESAAFAIHIARDRGARDALLRSPFLLFFGAKRLPEIGSSMGRGIREFQRSFKDTQDAVLNVPPASDDRTPKRMVDGGEDIPAGGEPKRLSQ